ncbi:MAG: NAD(P)/FAD-dependent oxidoreductase [candidate division Zixibacteria bacterium]|nr:NAD(P)/FAD-dependent oxidoreductase [candidate division Zixibacteria bacterium]
MPHSATFRVSNPYDVAIVGAGPSGAMTALHLARQAWRAVLIDRDRFPRDKVCGDGLIPDSLHVLERAGLLDRVRKAAFDVNALTVYGPSRGKVDLSGTFLTIKRFHLDHLLFSAAVENGSVPYQGRVRAVAPDGPGVRIDLHGASEPIRARTAVLATGADMGLFKTLQPPSRLHADATALRCYVRSKTPLDRLVISFDRSILPGYAWIFPLRENEFNIGCGVFRVGNVMPDVNLRDMFDVFATGFPLAKEIMEAAETVSPLRGAMLRCGLRGANPLIHERILAVGETIGTTFPFTGEGIGKAMETGELAASVLHEALQTDDFQRLRVYPEQIEDRLRPRYYGYSVAEKWLASAFISDFMIARARRSPYLRRIAADIIEEKVDPRAVFSVRGILKSMWR